MLNKNFYKKFKKGQEGYFDNESILNQFERLFQMLEFKSEFIFPIKHDIEIVVDNARTHSAQEFHLHDFRYEIVVIIS